MRYIVHVNIYTIEQYHIKYTKYFTEDTISEDGTLKFVVSYVI